MITKLGKKSDEPIFKQIINLIPPSLLAKSINKFKSDKSCSKYYTYDQLTSMLFGQLNKCLSLREIAMGIDQSPEFLADIELAQNTKRSKRYRASTSRLSMPR